VTLLNDLTDRDMQKREVASGSRFWTSKNAPGFGPVGPEIVTMDEIPDPYDLWLTCAVNGEERMRVNTREQIWRLSAILEHFSRYIPVEPGDMFSTGAPGGVAVGKANAKDLYLKAGDVVECSIEGITTLRTTIVPPSAT
jgi:2-keto-4-pentenoate hydratase/2-oxohepta-3-ene-1,7-dioic acid hydratase in catechol pathway